MLTWLQFIACTLVIIFSGARLSRYGDVIGEKTGMGRTWIGVVLMASVTSLPELVTGISSVALYRLPNIAAGDVLGSCVFNLVILALLDVRRKTSPISTRANQGHVLTASFGILLLGLTTLSILTGNSLPALGWVGVSSVVLLLVYLAAMRVVFRFEKRRVAEYLSEVAEEPRYKHISTTAAYQRFSLYAALLVGAATYLPLLANHIAAATGLSLTFVGSMFVALATSLPEVVVTREAIRLGSVDLAVGNILGSNLFNIAILAVDDFFYFQGPILSHVSPIQAVTATAAMTMMAILTIALVYRSEKRMLVFSWDSLGILLVYVVLALILFYKR
jgi:cation:H+ antiporter